MVLTCRPCSGATPRGNNCGTAAATRHLEAETNWAGAELVPACSPDGVGASAIGAAATISKQQGATVSATFATWAATGLVSRLGAGRWTSAPAAKNTAAGAMTAARTADDFRRSLANSCRPTDKHHTRKPRQMSRSCHDEVTEQRWRATHHRPPQTHFRRSTPQSSLRTSLERNRVSFTAPGRRQRNLCQIAEG